MKHIFKYERQKHIFIYNAKAEIGTVRTWSDGQDHKKTEDGWITVTKGKSSKSTGENIKSEIDGIKDKYKKEGVKLDLNYSEKNDKISLPRIVIPKEKRSQGLGSKVMEEIIKMADKNKTTVTLTPSEDFGGNKKKLIEFYKRFGFEENKGKNKDYEISDTMYRKPK